MHVHLEPEFCVPVDDHALPPRDARAAALAMFESASYLAQLGVNTQPDPAERATARAVALNTDTPTAVQTSATAIHLKTILDEFDHQVVDSMAQLRQFVTNSLIDEAQPGKKSRIRALELLGKISGVDLFTERSEVTIKHKTTEDIHAALRAKIAKVASTQDVQDIEYTPAGAQLPSEPVPTPFMDPFDQINRTVDAITSGT